MCGCTQLSLDAGESIQELTVETQGRVESNRLKFQCSQDDLTKNVPFDPVIFQSLFCEKQCGLRKKSNGKINLKPFEMMISICTKMGERKNKKNKVGQCIFGNSEVKNIRKRFFVEKCGK